MSIDHSDRLTAEQRQRIRQVQQYVEDHAAEVDAAARVDDPRGRHAPDVAAGDCSDGSTCRGACRSRGEDGGQPVADCFGNP